MNYLYLGIAILAEVVATSSLKASESFSRVLPSLLVVVGYAVAFYFLSLTLRAIPIGIAYAMWSGIGVVLVTIVGTVLFKQPIDAAAIVGISFIVVGVLILNLLSKASSH
jgi:small multidrug resistance pump